VMRFKLAGSLIVTFFLLGSQLDAQQHEFPVLKGPYLGQRPPGTQPEVFGPGVISVDENFEHSAAVFSPRGDEVFWCTNVGLYTENGRQGMLRLYHMTMVDGTWTAPQPAPFAEDIRVERPVFSPDGNSLYFDRESDLTRESDADIFVVHRTDDGWSEPEPVSPLINSSASERLHSVTSDGSMYFTRNLLRDDEEVLVSRWVAGAFSAPEKLGAAYNQNVAEYAIVFGPNEDYMLINQQAAPASANVFISYKRADGSWSDRIETPYYSGGFLSLSPDGKYLFTMGEAIYWISTSFVEDLRPEHR
jgi:hypothetical protein